MDLIYVMQDLVICDVEVDEDSTQPHQQHLQPLPPSSRLAAGATLGRRLQTPSTTTTRAAGSSMGQGAFQSLPPEQQRRLAELVWGGASVQPEAAWKQGFMWCGAPGLEWGLLQVSGEACVRHSTLCLACK
jgi:hypothetical protein